MEDYESVADFFAGETVFVTGASGFLGGVLVEKLLRSCPDVKHVYLLMRPRKDVAAEDRLKDLLRCPLFSLHDPEELERRVSAVGGDVSLPGLGLREADREMLEQSVSVVLHCAATTNFNATIRHAVNTNLCGTQRVLQLCHKMPHIKVILYTSTAFCNCTLRDIVAEEVYPISRDPEEVIKMVEEMSDAELLEAKERILGGHPNAYTFSKQMAENLLRRRRNNIPVVIVRPSIVVGTYAEPIPGWLGGINNGSCAFVAGSSKGVIRVASSYPHLLADIVPCDLVCNLCIAATAKAKEGVHVYHCTSGERNPITWEKYVGLVEKYTREHPCIEVLWLPSARCRGSLLRTFLAFATGQLLPAILLYVTGMDKRLLPIQQRYWRGVKHVRFFTTSQWRFSVANSAVLQESLSSNDKMQFPFDLSEVSWPECMENCVLGAREYVHHEDPSNLPEARNLLTRYYGMHVATQIFTFCVFFLIMYFVFSASFVTCFLIAAILALFIAWL